MHAYSRPKVFECLVLSALFQNDYEPHEDLYTDVHLLRMTQLLGPFPKHFLAGCSVKRAYFDDKGEKCVEFTTIIGC